MELELQGLSQDRDERNEDYLDEDYARKVYNTVEAHYMALKDFRSFREEIYRQYVGRHYGVEGATDRIPLNIIEMALDIFKGILGGTNMSVIVVAKDPKNAMFAEQLNIALNHILDKINFASELELTIMESLITLGVIKIGISMSNISDRGAFDAGQYFADCVTFEDFVCDVFADKFDSATFIGNKYWAGLEDILQNPSIPDDAKDRARQKSKKRESEQGQQGQVHSIEALSGSRKKAIESLDYQVRLWDVWLRRENLLITYMKDDPKPLWIRPWLGPRTGPYRMLCYHRIPKNIVPRMPAAGWKDNHDALNVLFRKYIRGALRRKSILAVMQTHMQDGERIRDAADGDTIPVTDPAAHREIAFGGADNVTLGAANVLRQLANAAAGNIELLGGIRQQAPTLGQDQILNQNASDRVIYMTNVVMNFVKKVISDIAAWVWDDPFLEVEGNYRVPGTTITVPLKFTPYERRGTIDDYGFEVIPNSNRYRTPSERVMNLMQVVNQLIVPMTPLMMQQGLMLDSQKIIGYIARYLDLPELMDIISPVKPQGPAPETAYGREPLDRPTVEARSATREQTVPGTDQAINEAVASVLGQSAPGV